MTLHRRDLQEIPTDIAAVGRRILPPTDRYRVIGDHLADLLDDAQFAELYEPTGRAAISPSLLALVTLFPFVEDLPDREATTQVVVRLDWKYALHLPLAYAGFDHSCLCHFRQRLLTHAQERLVFDTLLRKIQALGFIKKRGKQRTDSLAVLGAVRALSALETVSETLRLAVRALVEADAAWRAPVVPASFQAQYLHSRPDYRLTAAAQAARFLQVGRDGYWLLDQVALAPPALREVAPLQVLQAVWGQRYERADGPVRVREQGVDGTERIVTPHDPGVRAGEKRGKQWHGDKVHVTETAEADGPNPQRVQDRRLRHRPRRAPGDLPGGPRRRQMERAHGAGRQPGGQQPVRGGHLRRLPAAGALHHQPERAQPAPERALCAAGGAAR